MFYWPIYYAVISLRVNRNTLFAFAFIPRSTKSTGTKVTWSCRDTKVASLSLPCAQLCQGSSSKHQCKCHKLCAGQLDENLPVQCAFSTLFPLTLRASHQIHLPHTSVRFSFVLPFLGALFPFPFLLAKFKPRDEFLRGKNQKKNMSWTKTEPGQVCQQARHTLLLTRREWDRWQGTTGSRGCPERCIPQVEMASLC